MLNLSEGNVIEFDTRDLAERFPMFARLDSMEVLALWVGFSEPMVLYTQDGIAHPVDSVEWDCDAENHVFSDCGVEQFRMRRTDSVYVKL